jgi:hypothetical protein
MVLQNPPFSNSGVVVYVRGTSVPPETLKSWNRKLRGRVHFEAHAELGAILFQFAPQVSECAAFHAIGELFEGCGTY